MNAVNILRCTFLSPNCWTLALDLPHTEVFSKAQEVHRLGANSHLVLQPAVLSVHRVQRDIRRRPAGQSVRGYGTRQRVFALLRLCRAGNGRPRSALPKRTRRFTAPHCCKPRRCYACAAQLTFRASWRDGRVHATGARPVATPVRLFTRCPREHCAVRPARSRVGNWEVAHLGPVP